MNNPADSLFHDVQMQEVFTDSKTFADCIPRFPQEEILFHYLEQKSRPGFELRRFIETYYERPQLYHTPENCQQSAPTVTAHIEALWEKLTRIPGESRGSLIGLPYPYIVPGGRFGEIYYWDSYFTLLGLSTGNNTAMIRNMVRNCAWLIDTYGFIPNGNRQYYLGRSQPPFFSRMVQMLAGLESKDVLTEFLPQIEKEYAFWMRGRDELQEVPAYRRVVKMPDGEILNRYWDEFNTPRPESYREDLLLAGSARPAVPELFRQIRAGAESGWDFSSRWMRDGKSLGSLCTTEIVPVDLNCLLYGMEMTLADAWHPLDRERSAAYRQMGVARKQAIRKYCWRETAGFYSDFDLATAAPSEKVTMAGCFTMYTGLADAAQAQRMHQILQEQFLRAGGLLTTLTETGQQWDAPNGWAPLQWIAVTGLNRYGYHILARDIAGRWSRLCEDVFRKTGKMMEKYNVVDPGLEAGGGEYPGQDGFGWTNGVYLALKNYLTY